MLIRAGIAALLISAAMPLQAAPDAVVESDSFHKYERDEMRRLIEIYENTGGRAISHFGPEANLFEKLETLFREYGAQHVDLLIGVTPTVNLEWVQKIHRDMQIRGYSIEAVTQTILRRMYDYVHFITPQFSRAHVNFQRVLTVDTSNPFVARDIPSQEESFVVIRFADADGVNFPYLLAMIDETFQSQPDTISCRVRRWNSPCSSS